MNRSEEANAPAERLAELELRITFQEEAIEALGRVVYRQERTIAQLERQLARLVERARQLAEGLPDKGGHEPPPHY